MFLGLEVAQVTYHYSISIKHYLKNKKTSTLYTGSIELKIQLSDSFFQVLGGQILNAQLIANISWTLSNPDSPLPSTSAQLTALSRDAAQGFLIISLMNP